MSWNDDSHGIVTRSNEIKCYTDSHTWGNKLSQLHKQDGLVRAMTYSLNADYACEIFERRPSRINLIVNSKYAFEARKLKQLLPGINILCRIDMHAKLVLVEPKTVYLGSMNFVRNTMLETVMGVRGKDIHDRYATWFDQLWSEAKTP